MLYFSDFVSTWFSIWWNCCIWGWHQFYCLCWYHKLSKSFKFSLENQCWLYTSFLLAKLKSEPELRALLYNYLNWSEVRWKLKSSIQTELRLLYISFRSSQWNENFREDLNMVPKLFQILIKMQNPSQELPASSKAQNQDIKDIIYFAPSKSA